MIKNYLKIALRNLLRNKGYSFLNIAGLAIGITCAAFIFLWIENEVNYNSVFEKQDTVYYVPTNQKYDGEYRTIFATPGPLAPDLKAEIPEIIRAARTSSWEALFAVEDNAINVQGRYADPEIIDIFTLKFVEGNPITSLVAPHAIVINEKTAIKLFGQSTDVIGRTIKVDNEQNFTISGVIEDLPQNVTFGFNWLIPFNTYASGEEWMLDYRNNFADTFVELSPDADFTITNQKVLDLMPTKTDYAETRAFLHPLKDWHLRSEFENGVSIGGRISYVRLFGLIALIILLIACINFMNLATASSAQRAAEVGVRKVLGSGKRSLVFQFLAEAILTTALAALLSIGLLIIFLPQFNLLIENQLTLGLADPSPILALIGFVVVLGLISGLYPAFYLSSFKPIKVLKGISKTQGGGSHLRKGLVIAQFSVSIIFIISTIIIYQQVQYVKERDLGYEKDGLLRLPVSELMQSKFETIKQEMLSSGTIGQVAYSSTNFLNGGYNGSGLVWQGGVNTEDYLISFRVISSDFMKTVGMEFVEGRPFSNSPAKDSANTIISKSFAKLLGEGSALNKKIKRGDYDYNVIGVVEDFIYGDMYSESDPVMFFNSDSYAQHLYVKSNDNVAISAVISTLEEIYKKHNSGYPFEYSFVDEDFDKKFKSEALIGKLSQVFALLAIIISCLGLFGLSAFTSEQRKKEVGVRKVLGSSVTGIVRLLSKDFMILVLVSIVVAIPFAWWFMHNWLQDFAYRIDIKWWVFGIAGITAAGIAMATVSFQAIKAATANPVKSLRTE